MNAARMVAVLLVLSLVPALPLPSLGPNRPPSTPVIEGPSAVTVEVGSRLTFVANTSDPEIYDVLFWTWIWGDGTNSSMMGNATVPLSTEGHVWTSVGVYFVNVTVADSWSPPIPCAYPVVVTVVPPSPGTLMGTVVSAGLAPVAGADVIVVPGGHASRTNASGGYALVLAPGVYSVTASAPGYEPETKTDRAVESAGITTVDFALLPLPGNVTGTVRGATGTPVVGATVTITTASGTNQITVATLTTNGQGGYGRSVPSGTYIVTVAAPGFAGQSRSGVYVAPGQNVTVDFALIPESAPSSTLSFQAFVAVGGVLALAIAVAFLLRWRRKLT